MYHGCQRMTRRILSTAPVGLRVVDFTNKYLNGLIVASVTHGSSSLFALMFFVSYWPRLRSMEVDITPASK